MVIVNVILLYLMQISYGNHSHACLLCQYASLLLQYLSPPSGVLTLSKKLIVSEREKS